MTTYLIKEVMQSKEKRMDALREPQAAPKRTFPSCAGGSEEYEGVSGTNGTEGLAA
ncbi:hypothetical protein BN871_LH_00010, partial [Paenibacillus sp. P22]